MPSVHPELQADRLEDRAVELLYWLAGRVRDKAPAVVSHRGAFRILFPGRDLETDSEALTVYIEQVASMTSSMHIPGLGAIKLSSFIVDAATRRPSEALQTKLRYQLAQWEMVLGEAELLDG